MRSTPPRASPRPIPDAAGYWGLSTTTAADQVQLLRTLAYPNSVLTPASRAYELNLMEQVEPGQAWGVSAGVAAGSTVALKNGWLPLDAGGWQVNSIGHVDGRRARLRDCGVDRPTTPKPRGSISSRVCRG